MTLKTKTERNISMLVASKLEKAHPTALTMLHIKPPPCQADLQCVVPVEALSATPIAIIDSYG